MILTAIIHPEGIAPYMQSTMRYAGNWLVSAIPGAAHAAQRLRRPRIAGCSAWCSPS